MKAIEILSRIESAQVKTVTEDRLVLMDPKVNWVTLVVLDLLVCKVCVVCPVALVLPVNLAVLVSAVLLVLTAKMESLVLRVFRVFLVLWVPLVNAVLRYVL